MASLKTSRTENVLVGLDGSDDAGVYQLNEEIALVQTVDFLTPVADDPFTFGRIAAANALSDVYAMGGRPLCAMNIVSFPIDELGPAVLEELLAGGLSACESAGCVLLGGHSIADKELKYGLSVTGSVHPQKILQNKGMAEGDLIVLTKALGTGILSTALKAGLAENEFVEAMYASMMKLNRDAAEAALEFEVHGCTDVTGFGLAGHAMEMTTGSKLTMQFFAGSLPLLPGMKQYAEQGFLPGGLHRNRCFYERFVQVDSDVPAYLADVLFDPQTSGGLLVALDSGQAGEYVSLLAEKGETVARIIGRVVRQGSEGLRVVSGRF